MADYRKMYLRLVDEVERTLDILDSSRDLEQKVFLSQALLAAGLQDGSVKSYAQICFGIWQKSITGGRLNRPLVTLQQAGRKGSRAAVRRSSCP